MQLEPGTVLAGKYRVEELLGEGGMGVVVLATHMELDQRVAIKVPRPEHVKDPTFAARFIREGKNAARIRNDHIARVLDVGRDGAGNPFLVMEYLEGFDLSRRMRSGPELDIPDSVDIVLQTCIAVAAAHSVGVIHRDLKPANLFLESRPDGSYFVKVLDFGISKMVNDGALENALTNTTGVIGSPMYMSPEQMVSARDVDVRTDVWSLGLILFRILTGKTPWPSANPLELATRMARENPRTPRSFRPEIPQGLEDVIMHALARNRDERTPTVYDFARAIAPFDPARGAVTLRSVPRAANVPIEPRPADSSGRHEVGLPIEASTMATSAITLHTAYDTRVAPSALVDAPRPSAPPARPKKTIWIAGGSVFAVATAIVLFVALRSGSPAPEREHETQKAAAAPKAEEAAPATKEKPVEPAPSEVPSAPSAAPSEAPSVVAKPVEKPIEAPKPVITAAPKPAVTEAPKPPTTAAPKPTTKPTTTKPGADPWGGW
jgi:serine/threonine-protein kinase